MEPHETDRRTPSGLRSRVDELRRRIVSLSSAEGGDIIPLDRRVLDLSERIDEHTEQSASELAATLGDPTLPRILPTESTSGASSDAARRVRGVQGQLAPLRQGFAALATSSALAQETSLRSKLHRGRQLVELADRMIAESAGSPNQQWALAPAWEAMIAEASRCYAEIAGKHGRHQRHIAQVHALREFHAQLLAGNKPRWPAITDLAGRVLEDFDDETYPELVAPTHFEPSVVVATHAINVARIAAFLASTDASTRAQRLNLVIAALFMDVGMLVECGGIFGLARSLQAQERAAVERHPIESSLIAQRVAGFDPALADLIAAHHERLNGTGYPYGKRTGEIPAAARLLAVADVYTALRSPRAHRPARSGQEALIETQSQAHSGRLDPDFARGLVNLSMFPVGTVVELSSGEIAEVIAPQTALADPHLAAQPFLRICVDRRGMPSSVPIYRNLALRPESRIVRTLSSEEVALLRRAI